MESYELPSFNKPGSSATPVTPAPGYDPRTDNHAAGVARHHYYQVPVEAPRAKPWYRKRACTVTAIIVGIILLIAAIAVGLAVVFYMKGKEADDDKGDAVTTAVPVAPTTTEGEPTTMTVISRTTLTPSIQTVTLTKSAEESEEPSTIIKTITASEPEDMEDILKTLLSGYPYYTTELTTEVRTISNTIEQTVTREVTLTEEPEPEPTTEVVLTTQIVTQSNTIEETWTKEITVTDEVEPEPTEEAQISLITITKVSEGPDTTTKYEPTTVMVTASSDPSSTAEAELSDSSRDTSSPTSDGSSSPTSPSNTLTTEARSSSTSTFAVPSTSSSTPRSPDFGSPTLSNNSNLAAVDVSNEDSSLNRRLLVWQDEHDNLIARESKDGNSTVYRIKNHVEDLPKAMTGTPLTAAADDKGQVHVFFLNEDSKLHHMYQQDKETWTNVGIPGAGEYSSRTMLAATWHQSKQDTSLLVLLHMYDWRSSGSVHRQNAMEVSFSADYGETWDFVHPQAFKDVHVPAEGDYGITVASGIAWSDEDDDAEEPQEGEHAGLHVILEGKTDLQVIECGFENNNLTDCHVVDRQFHIFDAEKGNKGEYIPIETESHPTHLAWSQERAHPNTPAKLYGLFRLDAEGGELVEYTYVTGIEGKSSGGTTERHESMERTGLYHSSDDEENWIKAIASTEDRSLFLRGGQGNTLRERVRVGETWDDVGEIDTALTDDLVEEFLGDVS